MDRRSSFTALTVLALVGGAWRSAAGQQVQLTSPFQTINDRFYSNIGLGWGLSRRNADGSGFFFNTGPSSSAIPPFGGWDPGADARFGFGVRGGGGTFGLGLTLGEGSTRTNVVESPTIVIPNGGSGSLFSGSVRPFVTSFVPVVGEGVFNGLPMGVPMNPSSVSPLQERLTRLQQEPPAPQARGNEAAAAPPAARGPGPVARPEAEAPRVLQRGGAGKQAVASGGSTANHGDVSVAEIRRQQAAAEATRQQEILVRLERAKGCEAAGKLGVAKIYYQQAAARATGQQKQQLLEKIEALNQQLAR